LKQYVGIGVPPAGTGAASWVPLFRRPSTTNSREASVVRRASSHPSPTLRRVGSVALVALHVVSLSGFAATRELLPGGSFEAMVESLAPGDTLIVHAGTYADSGRISIRVRGTADAPVLITAADGEARPRISRSASAPLQNTINIEGATHLTIRGLEVTSNGGDGINLNSEPSHITLDDLVIHDVDVGVNFRSDMDHVHVRRCHIYDTGAGDGTGEGMYVGCNYGACVVRDSLIESNWIHDTLESSQGDGIEIKRGSHSNVVRNNVIHDTHYPCILLYGTEGNPRNIVEGNAMWGCGDSGIQVAADAVIRNNVILDNPDNGLNSQDHQEVTPGNIEFVHNTVFGGDPCLRMHNWSNKPGMVFANNAVYCPSGNLKILGLEGVIVGGNVIWPPTSQVPQSGYATGRSAALDLVDAAGRDAYPTADSPIIDAAAPTWSTAVDFNGTPRTGQPDAGAYTWTTSQNPMGPIQPGFKGSAPPAEPAPPPPEELAVLPGSSATR
jgi:hypothetical protein